MNRYISDLHFGHANIIGFDNRPYFNVEEMDEELIRNWNSVVKAGDTTYILGDFCWGKETEWLRILPKLNGNKALIRGNHDLKEMSKDLRKMFADVKNYKEISDNGYHVIMSHYPMLLYKGSYDPKCYMLCGHVHTTRENDFLNKWRSEIRHSKQSVYDSFGHVINVGCMMPYMGYTPRTLEEILNTQDWLHESEIL